MKNPIFQIHTGDNKEINKVFINTIDIYNQHSIIISIEINKEKIYKRMV